MERFLVYKVYKNDMYNIANKLFCAGTRPKSKRRENEFLKLSLHQMSNLFYSGKKIMWCQHNYDIMHNILRFKTFEF